MEATLQGDLICCETCPAVFHHKCLGLEEVPADDEWHCPLCSCAVCGRADFKEQAPAPDSGDHQQVTWVEPTVSPEAAIGNGALCWTGLEAFGEQAGVVIPSERFDRLVSHCRSPWIVPDVLNPMICMLIANFKQ